MVGSEIYYASSRKLKFGGAPSLLQSLKGGAYGFPESLVIL
jgi:hypothetical protein